MKIEEGGPTFENQHLQLLVYRVKKYMVYRNMIVLKFLRSILSIYQNREVSCRNAKHFQSYRIKVAAS